MAELRNCLDCNEEKDVSAFNNCVNGRGGLFAYCRTCQCARMKRWREQQKLRPKPPETAGAHCKQPISLPEIAALARIDAKWPDIAGDPNG